MVKSPCVGICRLDENRKICVGCKRTKEDITNWLKYSDEEKNAAVDKANERMIKEDHDMFYGF